MKKSFLAVIAVLLVLMTAGCGSAPQQKTSNGGGVRVVVRPKGAKVLPASSEPILPTTGQQSTSECGEEDPRGQRCVENYELNARMIEAFDNSGFWAEVEQKEAYARNARRQHMGY